MSYRCLLICLGILTLSVASRVARADVRLPEILDDHMVLQQNAEVQVWGWAYEGETVRIESSWGEGAKTIADAKGEWCVKLKTPAAVTLDKGLHPETITITAPGENSIQLKDLLIGELWVCSGQSNMVMFLGPDSPPGNNNWFGEPSWPEESKRADRPGLRLFNVQKTAAATPLADCRGVIPDHIQFVKDGKGLTPYVKNGWQPSSADTATYFSAVAYYFGAAIQDKLKVPVGLITSAVGGTGIEPWISLQTLRTIKGHENDTSAVQRSAGAALYNGMIAPLAPLKIRGVIWYQGESSVGLGSEYGLYQKALITDWRDKFFAAPDMAFYLVQLPPFGHDRNAQRAELREAQASVLQLKHTGMVVTNDLGELDNVHPKNKRDVGRRLALQALNKMYGFTEVIADGPAFQSMSAKDGKLCVKFRDVGEGLVSRDQKPLRSFEVAGDDGNYVSASAEAAGDEVIVWNPKVATPKKIRFAWWDAELPNLMSKNGLPAGQFRADLN